MTSHVYIFSQSNIKQALFSQDFPELIVIRAQLAGKYGKEYISEASSDLTCRKWRVNENLIR